ncbi:MAG: sucrose phosphorylase [Desulfobacterales bacterium]
MTLRNQVQLISYPDSLGQNLAEMHYVLRRYLHQAVSGVHILPFYPSSADRGFAPITYDEVDPAFGTWEDIGMIGRDFDLIIDFMVNHISRQSVFFQDYLEKGSQSEYADMFLTFDKLSPDGEISDEDLAKVYTRKPRPPYTVIERADGSKERIWCTFDYEQIDLDYNSPKTREVMRNFLIRLARTEIKMIRLDAFAYTTMEIGTNCFFLEPQVWEILDWLKGFASAFGVEVLPEVHEHHSYQLKMAANGYWTYDFCLPLLVMHTLYHHTNRRLAEWIRIRPTRTITALDTHDGMGVVDVAGLMDEDEIKRTINGLYEKGSNVKRIYSTAEYQNMDIYQVNCTYYSALEKNDDAYLAARTLQFFIPGIPQVYYVGLLAGENDIDLVERTRNGRNINRHNYTLDEIEGDIERPAVRRVIRLMEFRNRHPAFNGKFRLEKSPEDHMVLAWSDGSDEAIASVDLRNYDTRITYTDPDSKKRKEMKI